MREAMKDYVANNRESVADDRQLTRRRLAKGAAWSVPAVLATATVPAYAASKPATMHLYTQTETVTPAYCAPSANPQQGYISTLGTVNNAPTSIGLWADGQPDTVRVDTATIRYTFNHPVALTGRSNGAPWNTATSLNGWAVSQPDRFTVQFTKNGIVGNVQGTNFAGYFQNFKVVDGCYGGRSLTVKNTATVIYTDKTGQHTYTKSTPPVGI